jgi:hypothetical protein
VLENPDLTLKSLGILSFLGTKLNSVHSFKSLQIGCSVPDDNVTSRKQRTARTTLSRYVSSTNALKGKSHVRDSEIGCYPRLSMDPFQTKGS